MGIVFLLLICIGLIVFSAFLYCKLDDSYSHDLWSIVPLCFIIIFMIAAVLITGYGIFYGFSCANIEAETLKVQQTREIYTSQLETYEYDRPNRLTESCVYLELRKDIVKFNAKVAAAKAHEGHWWCEGILWERWYSGLEPINLK